MRSSEQPYVSVVTPFYNTEDYLSECIESVLAQTYDNFEYILVNNCSTDSSLEIANSYAAHDSRIRLVTNDTFLSQVQNYNQSLRLISKESKYCKIVQADDWIFTECLAEMVGVAEKYPSVGLVTSYLLRGNSVLGDGLPYPSTFVQGKKICKLQLLNHPDMFVIGSPTAQLIRSDLIRNRDPFYDESSRDFEDYEVWLILLKEADFGFVHKVLTFRRVENESITKKISSFSPNLLVAYICLRRYGKDYLTNIEYDERFRIIQDRYYTTLASYIVNHYNYDFFRYHFDMLRTTGYKINKLEFLKHIMYEIINLIRHPKLLIKAIKYYSSLNAKQQAAWR